MEFDPPANQQTVFRVMSGLIWVITTALCAYVARLFYKERNRPTLSLRKPHLSLLAGLAFNLYGFASVLELVFPELPCGFTIALQQVFFAAGISALTLRNWNLYFMMNVTINAGRFSDHDHRSSMLDMSGVKSGFWLKNRWLNSSSFLYEATLACCVIGFIPTIAFFSYESSRSDLVYGTSIDVYENAGYLCNSMFFFEWVLPGVLVHVALSIPALLFIVLIFDKQSETGLVSSEVFLHEESMYLSLILLLHTLLYPTLGFLQSKAPVNHFFRTLPVMELESCVASVAFFWFSVIFPYMAIEASDSGDSIETHAKIEIEEVELERLHSANGIEDLRKDSPKATDTVEGDDLPKEDMKSDIISMKFPDKQTEMVEVLQTPEGYKDFETFIKTELCVENLYFWKAAREFRKIYFSVETKTWSIYSAEMKIHLESIYKQFLIANAPLELNLSKQLVEKVKVFVKSTEVGTDVSVSLEAVFAPIEQEVLTIMNHNTYKRWVKVPKSKTIIMNVIKALNKT